MALAIGGGAPSYNHQPSSNKIAHRFHIGLFHCQDKEKHGWRQGKGLRRPQIAGYVNANRRRAAFQLIGRQTASLYVARQIKQDR
jgi:hypothetical protein